MDLVHGAARVVVLMEHTAKDVTPLGLLLSDYCFTPAAGSLAQISSLDSVDQPPGDSWRALTSRNAVRLLPHRA